MPVLRLGGDAAPGGRDGLTRIAKLQHPRPWVVHVQVAHSLIGRQSEPAQSGPDAGALRSATVAMVR